MFMHQKRKDFHTTKVWKLNKALYGLKSAPRAWNAHITKVLIDLDWVKSDLDECVFFKRKVCNKKQVTSLKNFPLPGIVIVYVDDLIVAGEEQIVQYFYSEFKKECIISEPEELKSGGQPVTFLGFEYFRGLDYIKIDPSKYVEKILEAFECNELSPLKTTGDTSDFILDHENR